MARFDHLAIAARSLQEGCEFVERLFGVALEAGGEHPLMGTHNRLLSLGPGAYLEVIAIDPEAPVPGHPRWFGLDDFSGLPRLCAWIVGVDDLDEALARAPVGAGRAVALSRGDLRWQMAVPADGVLPFSGVFPALIAWQGAAHPAARLPDRGVRLRGVTLTHPQAADLRRALAPFGSDLPVQCVVGPVAGLQAVFDTPQGKQVIG